MPDSSTPPRANSARGGGPDPSAAAAEERELRSMSLLEHLEELRKRIIRSLLSVAIGFVVAFAFADKIYAFMQGPMMDALRQNGMPLKLTYLNPTEPLNAYLRIALIAGIFLASPYVLWQVWLFISPGLYRHEQRYVLPFMFTTVGLFLSGGAFAYLILFPRVLAFLVHFGRQFQPMVTIGEYTDLFLSVVIGMGIVFEMPILIFFLALFGLVSAGFLWRNLRYAIFVIFVIAAFVTPTPDVMNMCVFAAPMIALYVLSIAIAWAVHPKRRRKRAEASAGASV